MKAYVAGKFEEKGAVRWVQAVLRSNGVEITHDWTQDTGSTEEQDAVADFNGVLSADFVLAVNHPGLYGGATEIGIALGSLIPVYVIAKGVRGNIFWHLPLGFGIQTFDTLDEALVAIRRDFPEIGK